MGGILVNKDEFSSVNNSKLKRLQGQEHTKKVKERNNQIIDDFLVGIDVAPIDLTLRLAIKYEMSRSQINRIVQDIGK